MPDNGNVLSMLIKNGRVIDSLRNIDEVQDVGVKDAEIVELPAAGDSEGKQIIDASGCLVLPGLIDFHTHSFVGVTRLGTNPAFLPATGVTTIADAGSSGCDNFEVFLKNSRASGIVRTKMFLSCCSFGMESPTEQEDFSPERMNRDAILRLKQTYPNEIAGLKIRVQRNLVSDMKPLAAALELAQSANLPLCVHVKDAYCGMNEIADMLRPGDIFCHVFHGTGNTILDADGCILPAILRARDRGVLFDVANGKKNCYHSVSRAALEQGFLPDILSTDMTWDKLNYASRVRSLPFVMSKFLSFGMELKDVARCVGETPARHLGLENKAGTLAPGAFADITILRIARKKVVFHDTSGDAFVGDTLLIPQMTILRGQIAFGQVDFNLPESDCQI